MIKKIFSLFAAILFAGSMWATNYKLVYTLDGSVTTGGNSNYAQDGGGLTQDGISWSVTGNTTINPWRIGGKNLSGVDREAYSKTAISDDIAKIEIEHGDVTLTAVNSVTVIVASNSDFSTVISSFTPAFEANNTITITRPDGKDWSNCFYKIVYNVTAGSSNSYVQLKSVKFYKEQSADPDIEADPAVLDLGTVYKSSDREEALKTFTLTGVNLTNQVKLLSSGAAIAFDRSEYIDPTDGAINVEVGVFPYSTDTKGEFEATISVKGTGENPDGIDKEIVIVTWKVVDAPTPTGVFAHYTGDIVAGKYVICDGTTAMKNVKTSSNRLDVATVEVTQHEEIVNPDASVIWEIAFLTGDDAAYFTIYNAEVEAYAAFTSSNGKADLLSDVTDYAKWYIDEDGEFTTKQKHDKVLRYNPGYGFASYSTGTGNALKLYKYRTGFPTSVDNTVDGKKAVKFIENGQLFIELNGHIYNVQGQTVK